MKSDCYFIERRNQEWIKLKLSTGINNKDVSGIFNHDNVRKSSLYQVFPGFYLRGECASLPLPSVCVCSWTAVLSMVPSDIPRLVEWPEPIMPISDLVEEPREGGHRCPAIFCAWNRLWHEIVRAFRFVRSRRALPQSSAALHRLLFVVVKC